MIRSAARLVGALTLLWILSGAPAVAADTAPEQPQVSVPHIIPQPNSGVAPKHAGDRGSGTQFLVLAGIALAPCVILLLVRHESKQKKAATPTA